MKLLIKAPGKPLTFFSRPHYRFFFPVAIPFVHRNGLRAYFAKTSSAHASVKGYSVIGAAGEGNILAAAGNIVPRIRQLCVEYTDRLNAERLAWLAKRAFTPRRTYGWGKHLWAWK